MRLGRGSATDPDSPEQSRASHPRAGHFAQHQPMHLPPMGMGTARRKMSKAPKVTAHHKTRWFLFCQIIQISDGNALTDVDFMAGRRNPTPNLWLGIGAFVQGKKSSVRQRLRRELGLGLGWVGGFKPGVELGLCSLCCSWLGLQLWQGWAERGGQTAGGEEVQELISLRGFKWVLSRWNREAGAALTPDPSARPGRSSSSAKAKTLSLSKNSGAAAATGI